MVTYLKHLNVFCFVIRIVDEELTKGGNNMKKWIFRILVTLAVLPVLTLAVFASGHGHGHGHKNGGYSQKQCQPTCVTEESQTVCTTGMDNKDCANDQICTSQCRYTDENDDGICDHCENICAQCGVKKDENIDGICDDCGTCWHYSDDNGDGVCDHQTEYTACREALHQNQARKRCHSGRNHRTHH